MMVKNEKQTTSMMYKTLISGIFSHLDDKNIGNSNPTKLTSENFRKIEACKGKIKFKCIYLFISFNLHIFKLIF